MLVSQGCGLLGRAFCTEDQVAGQHGSPRPAERRWAWGPGQWAQGAWCPRSGLGLGLAGLVVMGHGILETKATFPSGAAAEGLPEDLPIASQAQKMATWLIALSPVQDWGGRVLTIPQGFIFPLSGALCVNRRLGWWPHPPHPLPLFSS